MQGPRCHGLHGITHCWRDFFLKKLKNPVPMPVLQGNSASPAFIISWEKVLLA
jgi:hypothetical protein